MRLSLDALRLVCPYYQMSYVLYVGVLSTPEPGASSRGTVRLAPGAPLDPQSNWGGLRL